MSDPEKQEQPLTGAPAPEAPDTEAPPADAQQEPQAAAQPQPLVPALAEKQEGDNSWIIGLVFWLAIIAGAVWAYLPKSADIVLNVSARDSLAVEGAVIFQGARVNNGMVHLTIENAKNKRYLASAALSVSQEGSFSTAGRTVLAPAELGGPLRITARFTGKQEAKSSESLAGSSTVYVNFTPPLGRGVVMGILAGVGVMLLSLMVLFTGQLTSRKARVLFSVTYLVTFSACALPIVVTLLVAQNLYLVEMMEEAPIGLLKGTAKGIREPQWLVNIGGAVRKAARGAERGEPAAERGGAKPAAPATAEPSAAPKAEPKAGAPATPQAGPSPAAPGSQPKTGSAPAGSEPAAGAAEVASVAVVDGGLAIPFYVIILATLGAGINMTRRVPEIQKDHDLSVQPQQRGKFNMFLGFVLMGATGRASQVQQAAELRKELIQAYMYFLSAPFLAVAVYYLLAVVSVHVAEPVLVVFAFSTGLMSDAMVRAIKAVAERTLRALEQPPPPKVEPPPTKK
jgi:hypothetical protein